jgi:hypothetical protein
MSRTGNGHDKHEPTLTAAEQQFVGLFTAKGSPSFHLLVAPVGTDRTHVCAAVAHQTILRQGGTGRVLFLIPSALVTQLENTMLMRFRTPTQRIDRRKLRELVASVPVGDSPWPEQIVAIISMDTAKREDIADELTRVVWDLVLIDEPHLRKGVLDRLLVASAARRLLLLTAHPPELSIQGLATTTWENGPVSPGIQERRCVLEYERSPEEVVFLAGLGRLVDSLGDRGRDGAVAQSLCRCTASSLSAVESALLSLREARLRTDEPYSMDKCDGLPQGSDVTWSSQQASPLDRVLGDLDQVGTDPKFETLATMLECRIGQREGKSPKVCIWTRYQGTSQYLGSCLVEAGRQPVYSIDGSMTVEEKLHVLQKWHMGAGILVVTDAAGQGIDLLDTDAVVHYDLPMRSDRIASRMSCPDCPDRPPIQVHVFHDVLDAWPYETELLRSHGFLPSQTT